MMAIKNIGENPTGFSRMVSGSETVGIFKNPSRNVILNRPPLAVGVMKDLSNHRETLMEAMRE
ncbi:MAG: hypothetical protein R2834_17760 [Rhodothermales bacterium]